MLIGIIGSMEVEVEKIISCLENVETKEIGKTTYYKGTIASKNIVICKCGIGKVNASICASTLINVFNPDIIINTGIAGSLDENIDLYDIVIASDTVQHDFDTTAAGGVLGRLDKVNLVHVPSNNKYTNDLITYLNSININGYVGTISSSDKFVHEIEVKDFITSNFNAIAVDMESAAINHTCYLFNVPFISIRTISDSNNNTNYLEFEEKAGIKSASILINILENNIINT